MKTKTCMILTAMLALSPAVDARPAGVLGARPAQMLMQSGQKLALMSGDGEDAKNCVSVREPDDDNGSAYLVNNCGYTVEAAWCVENVDCQNGLSNTWTLGAGSSYPVYGTSGRAYEVQWGACRGANTISTTRGSMNYSCNAPL